MPRRTNTRERLVATAEALFRRQGYAQTGVNEIMQQAKTTSGSFYHFFPTKEDLLLAVIDHVEEMLNSDFFATGRGAGTDPADRVFGVLENYRRLLERHDFTLGSPLGSLAAELSASHPQVRRRLAELFSEWTDAMQALLEEMGSRLPDDLDRRALAGFILSTVEGAVLQSRVSQSLAPFDAAVTELDRHLALLERRSETPRSTSSRQQSPPPVDSRPADWRAW